MARKRSKKKSMELIDLIKGGLVILALSTYLVTESIGATLLIIVAVIILIISITIYRVLKKNEMLRNSGIRDIDRMDGIEFEKYLRVLFGNMGYKANLTKASGDFGADLVLNKDNKKIVVQAKRYKQPVGIKAVQEVRSAVDYYQANEAWVVTNSTFTDAAVKLASSTNVKLIDRNSLIRMIVSDKPVQN